MKNLQKLRLLLVLFLAIAMIQSCVKDDVLTDTVVPTANNPETESTDTQPETPNTDTTNSDDDSNNSPDSDGGEGEITLYRVDGENLIKEKDFNVTGKELDFQKDTAKHQEVWALTKKIIPASYLAKMSRFMIFAGENNGTAGYVYDTAQDLSEWEMGIAIDFAYPSGVFNGDGELAYTIIHEFGHILTLDNTQVDASISENDCSNYFTGEGCAKKEAYINKLQTRFWADIADEHSKLGEDYDKQDAFYTKYQDRFVTGYASTNPGEDIAEVFATFVTRNGGVNGSSIAEQKIQLMYDHSELIGLRDFIRGNSATAKGKRMLPIAGAWKKAKTFGNPKHTNCVRRSK
ncbi:hypothetical protein [Maribacter sp. 2308TA10-17]|uniref:hypothetical protein n=1 Tax=Maribacter sp. 2308TA10-17 TaxID=3386276 RepID=UPI0039BC2BC6